jgi:hypothetical protein
MTPYNLVGNYQLFRRIHYNHFLGTTPCSLAVCYQTFGVIRCLRFQGHIQGKLLVTYKTTLHHETEDNNPNLNCPQIASTIMHSN